MSLTVENFSNSEHVDMVMLYGVAAFQIVRFRVCDYGTFKPQTQNRGSDRTKRILQAEEQILERVEEEPDISTYQFAAEIGVLQFAKEQGLHPYHVQKMEVLKPADFPHRVISCEWLEQYRGRPNDLTFVVFSTATILAFGPMEIHALVAKYDFNNGFP